MATINTMKQITKAELIRAYLADGWDNKYAEYLAKESSAAYMTDDGLIFSIEKPHIKTSFYIDDENEAACAKVDSDMETKTQAFLDANLAQLKNPSHLRYLGVPYLDIPNDIDCFERTSLAAGEPIWRKISPNFVMFEIYHPTCPDPVYNLEEHPDEWRRLTPAELDDVIAALEDNVERFKKRLATYLKRYGLSKCSHHYYWANR